MKKYILIIIIVILVFVAVILKLNFSNKTASEKIKNVEYGSNVKISDLVNDKNVVDDILVFDGLGKKEIKYDTINEGKIEKHKIHINVTDKTAPSIIVSKKITVLQNSEDNIINKVFCADNYDRFPTYKIEGSYNLNEVGIYPLTLSAKDKSGNISTADFELHVVSEMPEYSNSKNKIQDIISKYKKENTKIGIDVSKWQGTIDWEKVKKSGVEFAMIRIGAQGGFNKDLYEDKEFLHNIEGALKQNIEVGIYFYSYATTLKEAKTQASWVINKIKDYKITLPIVFDWESWGKFNELDLNLYEITQIQETFLNEIKKNGYKTARYGSKNYLNHAWLSSEHDTWLAHYIQETNYEGKYFMWQLCNTGKVDGINSDVDIDILYN